tara:strand:- start:754 stop:1446 length:693 start_codon:yes stop_codon:yes gene_type:complete
MSRRASAPTPLPRSRLDEVLRAGIGEWSTPRALQPASVDVPFYTRNPDGGEPNKEYMQGMLWAQYPPPDPDTPMGRGETLYDPPKGLFVPRKEEAREQWEYELANWLVWADSRPYQGGAKAALLQMKKTFASLQRAFERLRSDNKATRLKGAKEFLNAMFARIYHLHSADEFVLSISSMWPVAASRANMSHRVTWSEVMRSAWSYYRALGAADEQMAAVKSQALAQWRRP